MISSCRTVLKCMLNPFTILQFYINCRQLFTQVSYTCIRFICCTYKSVWVEAFCHVFWQNTEIKMEQTKQPAKSKDKDKVVFLRIDLIVTKLPFLYLVSLNFKETAYDIDVYIQICQ